MERDTMIVHLFFFFFFSDFKIKVCPRLAKHVTNSLCTFGTGHSCKTQFSPKICVCFMLNIWESEHQKLIFCILHKLKRQRLDVANNYRVNWDVFGMKVCFQAVAECRSASGEVCVCGEVCVWRGVCSGVQQLPPSGHKRQRKSKNRPECEFTPTLPRHLCWYVCVSKLGVSDSFQMLMFVHWAAVSKVNAFKNAIYI